MARALVNALGMPEGSPDFDWIEIPTTAGLRAHTIFCCLINSLNVYTTHIGKNGSGRSEDRKVQRYSIGPNSKNHVSSKNIQNSHDGSGAKTIPIGMHGGGGSFSKHDNLYVISWNSLLGDGPTMAQRFIFTVIRDSDLCAGTMDSIFEVMAWSMNCLLRGVIPTVKMQLPAFGEGDPLCHGRRGALCQVRGDWVFFCKVFRFPAWNSGLRM